MPTYEEEDLSPRPITYRGQVGTYAPAENHNGAYISGFGADNMFVTRDGASLTAWDSPEAARAHILTHRKAYSWCKVCNPNALPPFLDCPHGHYLTPDRLRAQIHHSWHTDLPWMTVVFAALAYITIKTGFALFSVPTILGWALYMIGFLWRNRSRRAVVRVLSWAGPYSESPGVAWESNRVGRDNRPWEQQRQ